MGKSNGNRRFGKTQKFNLFPKMPIDNRHDSTKARNSPDLKDMLSKKQIVPIDTRLVEEPEVILTKEREEWTTCKRVVNHKTKQVETRVQRQLILEDGRVVADSGPQVTTKTTEDVRVEETENTKRKTTGDSPSRPGYSLVPGSMTVVSEKKQSNQIIKESKEEKRQLHDENFRELSGEELHQRMIIFPNDTSISNTDYSSSEYPGTLTHFSSHSQKVIDKEEVKEMTELRNGEESTETTRTHHHEEAYDDEVPEDEAAYEDIPEKSSETSRIIQYYSDPKEFDALSEQLQKESLQNRERLQGTSMNNLQWHENTLGSKQGVAKTRTSSGGNKITIEMSGNKFSPSDLSCSNDSLPNEELLMPSMHNRSLDKNNKIKKIQISNGVSSSSPYETINSRKSINEEQPKTSQKTFYLGENSNHNRQILNWKCTSPPDEIPKYSLYEEIPTTNRPRNNTHNNARSTRRTDANNFVAKHSSAYMRSFGSNKYVNKSDKEIQVSMSDDNSSEEEELPSYKQEHVPFRHHKPEGQNYASTSRKENFPTRHLRSKDSPHHSQEYDYDSPKFRSNNFSSAFIIPAQNDDLQQTSMSRRLGGDILSAEEHTNSKRIGERLRKDCDSSSHPHFIKSEGEREINYHEASTGNSYKKKNFKFRLKNFKIFPQKEAVKNKKTLQIYQSPSTFPSNSPAYHLKKEKSSDIYDSSSSLSSHEYPLYSNERDIRYHQKTLSSLRSSRSTTDLQSPKLLNSHSLFIPSSNSSDIHTMDSKRDRQKYYRKKSGIHSKV